MLNNILDGPINVFFRYLARRFALLSADIAQISETMSIVLYDIGKKGWEENLWLFCVSVADLNFFSRWLVKPVSFLWLYNNYRNLWQDKPNKKQILQDFVKFTYVPDMTTYLRILHILKL